MGCGRAQRLLARIDAVHGLEPGAQQPVGHMLGQGGVVFQHQGATAGEDLRQGREGIGFRRLFDVRAAHTPIPPTRLPASLVCAVARTNRPGLLILRLSARPRR